LKAAAAMDSGDEHEPEGSNNKNQHQRKQYHRHTPHQIQRLEAYARSSFS
jgi:homeobox-leucine zipper protein